VSCSAFRNLRPSGLFLWVCLIQGKSPLMCDCIVWLHACPTHFASERRRGQDLLRSQAICLANSHTTGAGQGASPLTVICSVIKDCGLQGLFSSWLNIGSVHIQTNICLQPINISLSCSLVVFTHIEVDIQVCSLGMTLYLCDSVWSGKAFLQESARKWNLWWGTWNSGKRRQKLEGEKTFSLLHIHWVVLLC